ncbi:MAG: DegQ family serine endoprotease [Acidobacteria bacterium]|jgi:Do/DeqQ family serine protease|nr:DegQ family serine endoprotease [Acidobacteriota bacterium]
MLKKIISLSTNNKFLSFLLAASLLTTGGCKTDFLTGATPPAAPNDSAAPPAPPAPLVVDGVRTSYADVVGRSSPAVVRIDAERKSKSPAQQQQQHPFMDDPMFREFFKDAPQTPQQPFNNQQPQQRPPTERGLGSGVIVSADGTVLTNHHVIDGAEKIFVQMSDDKIYEAKIVGSDPPSDLAVLKIEGQNFPFLNLGNSDNVRVGDIVLAIGNPLGIGQTVTAGIISAKGRRTGLSDGSFEDFLQTDAPINRGNSGGALVSVNSELIGINSQILSPSGGNIGIGFSIPSNMAKSVMEQLLKDGKVRRGLLGVNIQNITPDMAKSLDLGDVKGIIVSNVQAGSAAEKAGIKGGDIILAINGEAIEDRNVLRNKVAGTQPGSEVKIRVLRDGREEELTAVLSEFNVEGVKPDNPPEEQKAPDNSDQNGKLGLSLQPLTPEFAKQLGLPAETEGMLVTEIDQNGAAASEGINRGDVILEINKQTVKSLEEVQTALARSGDKPVLLLISRKGQTTFLTIQPR